MTHRTAETGGKPKHPLRSSNGGYLCSPFTLQPAFETMAEKYTVRDGKGSSGRLNSAREVDDDGGPGRPWMRAGVGAKTMSAKERRQQQQEAERIYGPSSYIADGEDELLNSSGKTSSAPVFAISSWEKAALQSVIPRGMRQRNGKQGERNNSDSAVLTKEVEEDERVLKGAEQQSSLIVSDSAVLTKEVDEDERVLKGAEQQSSLIAEKKRRSDEKDILPARVRRRKESAGSECHDGCNGSSANVSALQAKKPINKLQMLDQMRDAALFGKKKKGLLTGQLA
ncbi:uncharacterized protein TEOVI_000680400 [Trypanosoma equiperdum]|uniref:Uncharacterized protein n=1 Tax=Trypanosoma equiperdum TaxID=5694 RepID=A0A1G4I6X2_TRYEQ|nr:hypothetical protein, conserved [Trypanosoma equiperdum]